MLTMGNVPTQKVVSQNDGAGAQAGAGYSHALRVQGRVHWWWPMSQSLFQHSDSFLLLVHQHSGVGGLAPQLLVEFGDLLHRDTLALHVSFERVLSVCLKGLQLHTADLDAECLGWRSLAADRDTHKVLQLALTWQIELPLYQLSTSRQHRHQGGCMSCLKRRQFHTCSTLPIWPQCSSSSRQS